MFHFSDVALENENQTSLDFLNCGSHGGNEDDDLRNTLKSQIRSMVYRVVGQDMKDSICTRIDREDKDGLKKISEIMTKIHTDRIANFDDES